MTTASQQTQNPQMNFLRLQMTLRLLSFFIVFVCAASPVQAGLTPMENSEMEDVCGSAGVTIAIKNVQLFQYIDSFRYYANNNGILCRMNQNSLLRSECLQAPR